MVSFPVPFPHPYTRKVHAGLSRWLLSVRLSLWQGHDFSGKKIVLFATSGGSGFGNTVKELQPSAPDAIITEGSLLNRGTKQEISAWVKSL